LTPVIQATFGDGTVNMGMQGEGSAPGVQDTQNAGLGTQVSRIIQKTQKRFPDRLEQPTSHLVRVAAPIGVQFVRQGKNHMAVRVINQA
jgi:hypothetical protein